MKSWLLEKIYITGKALATLFKKTKTEKRPQVSEIRNERRAIVIENREIQRIMRILWIITYQQIKQSRRTVYIYRNVQHFKTESGINR